MTSEDVINAINNRFLEFKSYGEIILVIAILSCRRHYNLLYEYKIKKIHMVIHFKVVI